MSLAFARFRRRRFSRRCITHGPGGTRALVEMLPRAPLVAISSEQAQVLQGAQCRRNGAARGGYRRALTFREHPDDYLLFLRRGSPKAKGVLQAMGCRPRQDAARAGGGGGERLLSRHCRTARRRNADRLRRRSGLRDEGETVRRSTRAPLPCPVAGRSASLLAEAMACGCACRRARSRRRPQKSSTRT